MRKLIIGVRIALGAILLFVGSFFFIVGVWSVLAGYAARPAGLGYLVTLFGGSMMAAGIIVVLKLFEERKLEWIIVSGATALSATLLFFGFFLLIVGVQPFSFFGPLMMIIGGPIMIAGIITLLRTVR